MYVSYILLNIYLLTYFAIRGVRHCVLAGRVHERHGALETRHSWAFCRRQHGLRARHSHCRRPGTAYSDQQHARRKLSQVVITSIFPCFEGLGSSSKVGPLPPYRCTVKIPRQRQSPVHARKCKYRYV